MQANRLPAARGWYWFVGGLRLWQRNPAMVGLAAMLSFFFSGRNIFNDPQLLMEGDPIQGAPAALYRYGNYGVSWIAGVRGNF